MKLKRIPQTVVKQDIYDALSALPDDKVSNVAVSLRRKFAISVCKILLGCTVKQAQKKVFK